MERGKTKKIRVEAAVIGGSHGSLEAFRKIIAQLSTPLSFPLVVVFHQSPESQDGLLESIVQQWSVMKVKEAEDKEQIENSVIYLAPAGYHLLIENDRTFALNVDERVNYSRPSIDVLFESAADTYGDQLFGCVLTGANRDGAAGLRAIKAKGGLTIVQDPQTSLSSEMPQAAIETASPDLILSPEEIGTFVARL